MRSFMVYKIHPWQCLIMRILIVNEEILAWPAQQGGGGGEGL